MADTNSGSFAVVRGGTGQWFGQDSTNGMAGMGEVPLQHRLQKRP